MLRQERDVHDPDFVFQSLDIEASGRRAAHFNNRKLRSRIVLPVIGVLRAELLFRERLLLLVTPWHLRQFLRARAGIDRAQERFILQRRGPQPRGFALAALHAWEEKELSLASWREDALQRDAEVQREVRHHVVVRLVASGGSYRLGSHWHDGGAGAGVEVATGGPAQGVPGRCTYCSQRHILCHQSMTVPWNFAFQQSHCCRAARFAQVVQRQTGTLTGMHWPIALHIRQRKRRFTVAAVGGAKEGEERGVLRDRQDLPIAKRPALGREVEGKDADFRDEWVHERFWSCLGLIGLISPERGRYQRAK
jgi:hypothetical protein